MPDEIAVHGHRRKYPRRKSGLRTPDETYEVRPYHRRKLRRTPSGQYVRERVVTPRRGAPKRTVTSGDHKIVLEKLPGRKTQRTQAILHPESEFSPSELAKIPIEKIQRRRRSMEAS